MTPNLWRRRRYNLIHVAGSALLGAVIMIGAGVAGIDHLLNWRFCAVREAWQASPMPAVVVAAPEKREAIYRKPYTFTEDWSGDHLSVWAKVLEPWRGNPNLRYLEIGLFEGGSMLWMLENILTDQSCRVTGIDCFDGELRDRFYGNLHLSGAEDRVTVMNEFSQTALRKLPLDSFDIIYIDGSHVQCDVLEDAVLCWRLLKKGGLLIFDDYHYLKPFPVPEGYACPKVAVDAFYACFHHRCEVVHNGTQAIVRKTQ